ncbi:hypothetical protein ATANTOWER_012682 [Ataeniobius toweri]|uniref:Uncharacterized protein n=1 Tax=Ataeniobius toweri TaxID=208326 RepID=A0ABU7C1X7_9TELE|nr:hypothetical protein [Ataeniobius toweri]
MRSRIQAADMRLRDRMRCSVIRGELKVEPLLLLTEESVEVVQASDQGAIWAPPFAVFLGKSHWKETPGKTQNSLEGLYILYCLGNALESPRMSCRVLLGRGMSGLPSWICCPHDTVLR